MVLPNFIRVAWLLSYTRVKRTGILSNALIIVVMILTFLNLLFVRGILIGLPAGAIAANEDKYYSDVYISAPSGKKHIDRYTEITKAIKKIEGVDSYTKRYITNGVLEADFDERVTGDETPNLINTRIVGMNLDDEQKVINFRESISSGNQFERGSTEQVLLGQDLVSGVGAAADAAGLETLENVDLGTELELTVGNVVKKVTVVGFLRTKTNELDGRVIVSQDLFKELVAREDFKPDEIVIKVAEYTTPSIVQKQLLDMGVQKYADIETPDEYQPSFVEDIVETFAILGDLIGSISLVVAAITIFIIIFVNAITQRKQIGILKGIGMTSFSIELSYVFQALFYVAVAAVISISLLYGFLVPYFDANPIDFPFSDGVLVAEVSTTISRTILMIITTGIAGYLPARFIVKQNTLDAILGR